MYRVSLSISILAAAIALMAFPLRAADLTQGLMYAVPVPPSQGVKVDGELADWDLSAIEPLWISDATARQMHAEVAFMYDAKALYIAAKISLPGRPLHNSANPVDAFWSGDILQIRLGADPALPFPLQSGLPSNRIVHLSAWKNTDTGKDYLHLGYGAKLDKGFQVNPEGSQIVIKPTGNESYIIEAKVPWSALNVPDGSNPFAAGQRMTSLVEVLWVGGDTARTAAVYRTNPGSFGFQSLDSWGQVEFSKSGQLPPRHATMQQILDRLVVGPQAAQVGVPVTVEVPEDGLKVSVNILGPQGQVLRELTGGQPQGKGTFVVRWDGKDQWGTPMPAGKYTWGAYLSPGLKVEYRGGVGRSGEPYYETIDGEGAWGGDHSEPLGVASDATGLYFLWPVAEAGKAVVKTDFAGKVLWRKTPFVGGGFGPLLAIAADGKYVYLSFSQNQPQLLRLDAMTGQMLTFPGASATALAPISDSKSVAVPPASSPLGGAGEALWAEAMGGQPECIGLAVIGKELFASVYSQNRIQVLDIESGKPIRTLSCPGPRGLSANAAGDLYAVSYVPEKTAHIVVFKAARGEAQAVVTSGLSAPWGVAVGADGRLFVSDNGISQQIKLFTADGQPAGAWGKLGGRPWMGTYDPESFLRPAGIAADGKGGILVAESSIPKVMSRLDAQTGKVTQRWFGSPQYWNGTWPDPTDPWTVYYQIGTGIARATIPAPGASGMPSAYWNLPLAGYPDAGDFTSIIPAIVTATNGRQYLVADSRGSSRPRGICLSQGDQMLPVGAVVVRNAGDREAKTPRNLVEIWSDRNGDHRRQQDEVEILDTIDGKPLVEMADWFSCGSMLMTPNGDLYLQTAANRIAMIPSLGFQADGSIRWDIGKAHYVVPTILPSLLDSMYAGARGQAGLAVDSQGGIYTCFSAKAPAATDELRKAMAARFPGLPQWQWGAYATAEMAKRMNEGLGHTAESNAVKIARFSPDGKLRWMVGRKATAAAGPGEIYHHWILSGLIGDDYVAVSSEWGPIAFYTADGFFVDTMMSDPGANPPPGPYTFGSETGGARVQYFPARNEVWAYELGMAYQIQGFIGGKVQGEQRLSGVVELDRVYDAADARSIAKPLQIVALAGNPMDKPALWADVPAGALQRNGQAMATARLAYDPSSLYGQIHVVDDSPLKNSADTLATAFKGGDTAGITLGRSPVHATPQSGDVRIMAAMINGQAKLIAMKAITRLEKHPETYFTPSAGKVPFEYVGEVPGGKLSLISDADQHGYTATFAVPRAFLELDLAAGSSLTGDVEVRLSGAGPRGLQTTSRNYLFTPLTSETTMTDDMPTEARLYPQHWGPVDVR